MLSIRTIAAVSACVLAVSLAMVWMRGGIGQEIASPAAAKPIAGVDDQKQILKQQQNSNEPKVPESRRWQGSKASEVDTFLERWDVVVATEKGPAGTKSKEKLAQEALDTLGGGAALGAFIEGLHERRADTTVDGLLDRGMKPLFVGKESSGTREWLIGVADEKFKGRLLFQAGYYFSGPGLKEYLNGLKPESAQDRFLTGYCCGLAETDGFQAMKEFAALKPAKVTNYGMAEIMMHLPENTDFAKMSTLYPGDEKDLAKQIRAEMLKRWTNFHPLEAALYVVNNPKTAHPEQLGGVMKQWLATDPDAAASWVDGLPVGAYRDLAYDAQARYFLANDPVNAWKFAAKVGDMQKRVESATAVFKEWEKTDRSTATTAWVALFPPAQ